LELGYKLLTMNNFKNDSKNEIKTKGNNEKKYKVFENLGEEDIRILNLQIEQLARLIYDIYIHNKLTENGNE